MGSCFLICVVGHRIMLKGRALWRSSPASYLKLFQLGQVAVEFVQSSFEYLRGWSFHDLSGNPLYNSYWTIVGILVVCGFCLVG